MRKFGTKFVIIATLIYSFIFRRNKAFKIIFVVATGFFVITIGV